MAFMRTIVDKLTSKNRRNSKIDLIALSNIKAKHKSGAGRWYVSPSGTLYALWCVVLTVLTLYNLLLIPLRIAYYQYQPIGYLFLVDYCGDAIFLFDTVLRALFLVYKDSDEIVHNRKRILYHYLSTTAGRYHILALLPLDVFIYTTGSGTIGSLGPAQTLALLRMNKLCRLYDVNTYITQIETTVLILCKQYLQIKVNKNAIRLFKLIMVIITAAYVFGVLFFVIANQYHLRGDENNWGDAHNLFPASTESVSVGTSTTNGGAANDVYSFIHMHVHRLLYDRVATQLIYTQCVHSIYWAVAVLTTAGYGDVSPVNDSERLYNILLFILGTLIFAMVIVYLQDIVSQLDTTSDIHKSRVTRVNEFLSREHMSSEYLSKVNANYTKLWSQQRGADGTELQQFLPTRYYTASLFAACKQPMNRLFFVNKCNSAFRRSFVSALVVRQYLAGDYLFRTGEAGTKLYLIHTGEFDA